MSKGISPEHPTPEQEYQLEVHRKEALEEMKYGLEVVVPVFKVVNNETLNGRGVITLSHFNYDNQIKKFEWKNKELNKTFKKLDRPLNPTLPLWQEYSYNTTVTIMWSEPFSSVLIDENDEYFEMTYSVGKMHLRGYWPYPALDNVLQLSSLSGKFEDNLRNAILTLIAKKEICRIDWLELKARGLV